MQPALLMQSIKAAAARAGPIIDDDGNRESLNQKTVFLFYIMR
jgi:hypothetical protein